jgi:hypothetical protein
VEPGRKPPKLLRARREKDQGVKPEEGERERKHKGRRREGKETQRKHKRKKSSKSMLPMSMAGWRAA